MTLQISFRQSMEGRSTQVWQCVLENTRVDFPDLKEVVRYLTQLEHFPVKIDIPRVLGKQQPVLKCVYNTTRKEKNQLYNAFDYRVLYVITW